MTRLLTRPAEDCAQGPRLCRMEVEIPDTAPLDWLHAQPEFTQYYWADREGDFEMAGVGEADVLSPSDGTDTAALFRHIRAQLSEEHPSLRYYGGFRFHRGPVKGDRWRAFKEYRFVAPRLEVVRRNSGTALCCNARIADPRSNERTLESILADLAALRFPPSPLPVEIPPFTQRTDTPDQAGWCRLVEAALEAIARGDFEKVVLARETCFDTDQAWDPVALLKRLAQNTSPAFAFCFHPAPGRAFLGASPERLYKRVNCYVQSEALAGTRPRGRTDAADQWLGLELLNSAKERREHAFVVNMLEQNLGRFCRHTVLENGPSLMRLRNVQHLWTRIEGVLDDVHADAALIETLHPTPAVGGSPRERALSWLAREEPFDRGIFAGPVGWVGYDAAEFCVAIRSGLVQGQTLAVYTGAGIVAGSVPEEEWDEIECKMGNFLEILTNEDH
jgi:menaquinone-specific isochorismate synthase